MVEMEHIFPSGDRLTITKDGKGWSVDWWKPDDTNHWNVWYFHYSKAKAEYDKWLTRY